VGGVISMHYVMGVGRNSKRRRDVMLLGIVLVDYRHVILHHCSSRPV
jgi:hypothetical protein